MADNSWNFFTAIHYVCHPTSSKFLKQGGKPQKFKLGKILTIVRYLTIRQISLIILSGQVSTMILW